MIKKKILVTGAAGFIGYHLCESLLKKGHEVLGVDDLNGYYDINLKHSRLENLGIDRFSTNSYNVLISSTIYRDQFSFICLKMEDREKLPRLFRKHKFDIVCHLAAQAGVRFSVENPFVYIDSNLTGFHNVLESCKANEVDHLIYASSSSVYGKSKEIPFKESAQTATPISLYAATKKSNELLAHNYSHLFKMTTTGLRFFTVYGPWGRPDMAPFLFSDAILNDRPIKVFNHGELDRDFTYVSDIVEGIVRIVEKGTDFRVKDERYYEIYNIGNSKPIHLLTFIELLEKYLGKKAIKEMLPMQPGDVKSTWASTEKLKNDYDYAPETTLEKGLSIFASWYKDYFNFDS